MSMSVITVRLPDGIVQQLDAQVEKGDYSSRSDVIKTALRKMLWDEKIDGLIGISAKKGDSVKEIRALRKRLSKEPFDLDKLNKL
jgi:Arc/MetJ-type ribon-helix-helix transcriptional regulator